ncbi:MAG: hypothetical protein ACKUBY_02050 [Candidatus Moraniibacteriota bacterium]
MTLQSYFNTRIIEALISKDGKFCKVFFNINGFIIIKYYSISYNECYEITQSKKIQDIEIILLRNCISFCNSLFIECGDILYIARKRILRRKLSAILYTILRTDTTKDCLRGPAFAIAHTINFYLKDIDCIDSADIKYIVKRLLQRKRSPSPEETLVKLTVLTKLANSMKFSGTQCFIFQTHKHIEKLTYF